MKLYVGNLDHSVMDTELKALFSAFGTVARARVVTDHYTRQSKGFAYVVMAEKKDGVLAIERMNGQLLRDRPLVVNKARSRDKRLGQGW
ncbi:MAG: RNA-binding protein [Deltaproteobacteria bacterium]